MTIKQFLKFPILFLVPLILFFFYLRGDFFRTTASYEVGPKRIHEEKALTFQSCGVGKKTGVNEELKYSCKEEVIHAYDTAFVIVDAWESSDLKKNRKYERLASVLNQMRENNFFVIYGAGDAVLENEQYKTFNNEVKDFLGDEYCKSHQQLGSSRRREIYSYLSPPDPCEARTPKDHEGDISPIVKPVSVRNREYLVRYEDEMRYLLWKHKIKNLVFVGGAIEECLLFRYYGIHTLVGREFNQVQIKVFVVQDLVWGMPNFLTGISDEKKNEVLLTSLTHRMARITDSKTFQFH